MIRFFGIALLSLIVSLPACKKGEDDPFVSVRTRKNRLTGEWKVESYRRTFDFGEVRRIEYAKDTGLIYTLEDSATYSRAFQWTMTFGSEGDFTSEQREVFPPDSSTAAMEFTLITTESGEWKFTGGNGEPWRSELVFITEELSRERTDQGSNIEVTTLQGAIDAEVYTIDRLANDELWLSYEVVQSFPFEQRTEKFVVKFTKS